MKKHIYDENNGLSYTLHGDYYLPDIELPREELAIYGKYGMQRKSYMKEHKKGLYILLLTQGKLTEHLNQIDREASDRMELLVQQMAKQQGVTERLKEKNQMLWVGRTNNIRNSAEEIVRNELIYV